MEVKHLQFYACFLGVTETNTYIKSGWKSQQVRKRDREIDPSRAAKDPTKEDREADVILSVLSLQKSVEKQEHYREPVQALFTDPVSIFVSTSIIIEWRYLEEWRGLIAHTWTNDAVWLSILFSLGPQHLPKILLERNFARSFRWLISSRRDSDIETGEVMLKKLSISV